MEIQKKKISEIDRAKYNPRVELQPGDEDYESIKYSLETYGLVQPIVWNKTTNTVVAGHQRLNVLEAQGETEVDVSVVELDEIGEMQLNLALNRVRGRWDEEKLREVLEQLNEDASKTGFTDEEIEALKSGTRYFEEMEDAPIDFNEDFFPVTLAFETSERRKINGFIKEHGYDDIVQVIVNTAKGE